MKKLTTTLIFIFCGLFHLPLLWAQTKPWYMNIIKNMNHEYYGNNGLLIYSAQSLRTVVLFVYSMIKYDKITSEEQIKKIEAQLKSFETKLFAKEQKALLAIKKKFHINQKQWTELMESIEIAKNINLRGMQQKWPAVEHDETLPKSLKTILFSLFEQNNINPYSITINNSPEPSPDNHTAETSSLVYICPIKGIMICNDYFIQQITFFPQAIILSSKHQTAICAHEIEHLLQQHCITITGILNFLQCSSHLSDDDIHNNEEFQRLLKIHEQQAEIFSAIKNARIASGLASLRFSSCYPKYLYERHYYYLSTIHMLWQLHAWMKFWHQGGIDDRTKELKSKIEQRIAATKKYFINKLYV